MTDANLMTVSPNSDSSETCDNLQWAAISNADNQNVGATMSISDFKAMHSSDLSLFQTAVGSTTKENLELFQKFDVLSPDNSLRDSVNKFS